MGFTAEMVYMAAGQPSKVEPISAAEAGDTDLWTYDNYHPPADARSMRMASEDAPNQPSNVNAGTGSLPQPGTFTLKVWFQFGKVIHLKLITN